MAQTGLWERVNADWESIKTDAQDADPSPRQRESIAKLLKSQPAPWTCDEDEEDEWLNLLRYRSVPLSVADEILLVEAGPGCARGGQGSNGAMWLVRLDQSGPVLLAGPEQGFGGFLYSIQPSVSNGYKDVVLGWHQGLGDTGLVYFRFDGTAYRQIGGATLSYSKDDEGIPKIVPYSPNPSNNTELK